MCRLSGNLDMGIFLWGLPKNLKTVRMKLVARLLLVNVEIFKFLSGITLGRGHVLAFKRES